MSDWGAVEEWVSSDGWMDIGLDQQMDGSGNGRVEGKEVGGRGQAARQPDKWAFATMAG